MSINPMNFFEVGQQIGQARSPVTGPAMMIRNVLEQANKLGYLNAQTSAASGLATYKSQLDTQAAKAPIPAYAVDPEGNSRQVKGPLEGGLFEGNTEFIKPPAPMSVKDQILTEAMNEDKAAGSGAGVFGNAGSQMSPEDLYMQQAQDIMNELRTFKQR